jgi:RNA polymerase sigma-70 factor (ECF subfamily)
MFFKKKVIPNDAEVSEAIIALQKGSAEAFQILYQNYANKVYRFCLRMLGNLEQTEDAFQETFLKVYEKRDLFQGDNFASWLFAIARNTCLNYIRYRKDYDQFDETYYPNNAKTEGGDSELKTQIDKAISELPLPLREAIILREYEDFSYQEISDTLGVELSLVKVRIHRARLILRKNLKPLVKEIYES